MLPNCSYQKDWCFTSLSYKIGHWGEESW